MLFIDKPLQLDMPVTEIVPGVWLAIGLLDEAAASAPQWAVWMADAEQWNGHRRQSFLAGRALAARALQALGEGAMVRRQPDGAPAWPADIVGSISHTVHYAVAVVASTGDAMALGVDVEPDAPLPLEAATVVLVPQDHAALVTAFGARANAYSRLVFSAKECVHKAINPHNGAWLEFDEVAIEWLETAADRGRWQAHAISESARAAFGGQRLLGQWWRAGGALWTLLKR